MGAWMWLLMYVTLRYRFGKPPLDHGKFTAPKIDNVCFSCTPTNKNADCSVQPRISTSGVDVVAMSTHRNVKSI